MSVAVQNLITNSRSYLFHSINANLNRSKSHLTVSSLPYQKLQSFITILRRGSPNREFGSVKASRWGIRAFQSGDGSDESHRREWKLDGFNLDAILSVAEVLCIAPSVVFSIGCALNWLLLGSQKWFQVSLMNSFLVWQHVVLVGAVGIGALICRRQWRRIYMDSSSKFGGDASLNLVERVEKLEEDLRSSVTIIGVLSRQLEKLGIRFRVTRRTLKEPIAETAALAQKNSEATRALGMQEEILEKELGEIQKALLAMQEQQQKQLDLILAVGKSGKLIDSQQDPITEVQTDEMQNSVPKKEQVEMQNSVPKKEQVKQMEFRTERHGSQQ
ncbi:hypothetical protein MRB53_033539 [Persea americana]|uniref:Uncharacterized protein n=1 Tax=Persea americana TaxID=3435 RepID=A0ACC2KUZ2_PERAE|nr:hypothetical protein MRB53_033539 [Persea americana]|eukprot:TRINITY_DN4739_c0_g1_i1.p1 TRINITY_DN4739_c0_g1~~TRINITY_DN4739_c0_g1_i1.p1  ORF type:complete len:330 (-),score=76.46 TRINITY_DN4739_c0_g1_i1:332-1321(-)